MAHAGIRDEDSLEAIRATHSLCCVTALSNKKPPCDSPKPGEREIILPPIILPSSSSGRELCGRLEPVQTMPVVTLGFFSQADRSPRRAAKPAAEMQHRFHPVVAGHMQPLQNRSQVRRDAASFVFPSLPARPTRPEFQRARKTKSTPPNTAPLALRERGARGVIGVN